MQQIKLAGGAVSSYLFRSMLLLLVGAGWASAAVVGDVELPEQVQVNGYDQPLQLNGAGVRRKLFIAVYVGALYLPQRQVGVGTLLSAATPYRFSMRFVYPRVTRRQFDESWHDGFANNLSADRMASVAARLDDFVEMFDDMHEGDTLWLDAVPGRGTEVIVNGSSRGVIPGDDFGTALLAVWLGPDPVSDALKKALVGVDKD